jgi:hypothetical protein
MADAYTKYRICSTELALLSSLTFCTIAQAALMASPTLPTNPIMTQRRLFGSLMVQMQRVWLFREACSIILTLSRTTNPPNLCSLRSHRRRPPEPFRFSRRPRPSIGRPYLDSERSQPFRFSHPPFRCQWSATQQRRSLRTRSGQPLTQSCTTPKRWPTPRCKTRAWRETRRPWWSWRRESLSRRQTKENTRGAGC